MITDGAGFVPSRSMADDAGALLVRSGLVSSSALDDARSKVADRGGTVGEQLVASGIVTDDILTDFYKSRLLVPQVNPNTLARLSAKVVATIPSDMAIELRAIPVSLDNENNLTVAMSDPSDRHAVDEIAFFTGTYVVRAVATQMQIAWCLAHYYGHVTYLGQRLLQPNAEIPPDRLAAAVRPRQRGFTGKIQTMRHRAIAPVSNDTEQQPAIPELAGPDQVKTPRARSISGEIRVVHRAPSIRPPLPVDESGPIITMEIDNESSEPVITVEPDESPETHEDDTDRSRPAPRRLRPAEPDPPELFARAGEVSLKSGPDRQVADGPSIVIDDALETEAVPEPVVASKTTPLSQPIEVSGEVVVRDRGVGPAEPHINVSIEVTDEASGPVVIHERAPVDSGDADDRRGRAIATDPAGTPARQATRPRRRGRARHQEDSTADRRRAPTRGSSHRSRARRDRRPRARIATPEAGGVPEIADDDPGRRAHARSPTPT